jgi:superoxide dismutase
MHNFPMGRPLLVLEMYEHAYLMDYGAGAAKYVEHVCPMLNTTYP